MALATILLVASCTDPAPTARPALPPGTIAPLAQLAGEESGVSVLTLPPDFVQVDTRNVVMPTLPAYDLEQPPIPLFGGEAVISGTVLGADGPIEEATVRLERFVGMRGGYTEVTTNKEGFYRVEGLLGGHYRLRAWLKPDLTTVESQTTFLLDKGTRQVELGVQKFDANHLDAALDRGDPHVDQLVALKVLWRNEEVREEDGIIEGIGIPDVEIGIAPKDNENWDVLENDLKTNEDGYVEFFIVCKAEGSWPMYVASPDAQISVELPPCLPKEEDPDGTTPPDDGSTSTTDGDTIKPFAVGNSFVPPFDGPISAGTYVSLAESNCSVQYEFLFEDEWQTRQFTGRTIESRYPIRNVVATGGVPACRFTRTK